MTAESIAENLLRHRESGHGDGVRLPEVSGILPRMYRHLYIRDALPSNPNKLSDSGIRTDADPGGAVDNGWSASARTRGTRRFGACPAVEVRRPANPVRQ